MYRHIPNRNEVPENRLVRERAADCVDCIRIFLFLFLCLYFP